MGYASRSDPEAGVAVWTWMAPATLADWQRHLDDVRAVRGWPHPERRPCILIHLVDNAFVPDARQRREMAELIDHPRYRPNVALVTRNPLIRGVIQAVQWLRPEHHYTLRALRSLSHAVAWLEGERGAPLTLMEMLRESHAALGVGSRFVIEDKPSTVEL